MLTQEQQLFSSIKDTISMVDKNDDLAKLSLLTEDILLEHLKHRYDKNLIYTYLGDILVAVNPFQETNLYTTQIRDFYRYSTDIQKPPHVYALVDLVYRNVCHGIYKQQCCVISGESGSGKTESTKLFLKQLMYLCGGSSQLEQQILQATPLLESFGNAQTVMNNNSSRFGKYIALKFINGKVVGAQISDYLLEKSRVVIQSPGERNFHIFYYLFDNLPLETKQILCLRTKHDYKYLLTNPSLDVQNTTAMNSLDEVINAMSLLNFTDKEQHSMFRILSGILTIGNLEFSIDDEGFTQQTSDEEKAKKNLSIISNMFGVNSDLIMECLTTMTTLTRNERVIRKFSLQSSQDARDALSKHLYARLFSWLIGKINETLNNPYPSQSYHHVVEIGLLDIYGFEHFELNSFEQLCINLANEQIQFFFNQHIFRMEMTEYENEGIIAERLTFTDNQTLLELFMAKPLGILSLLDDESRLPKATDQTFVEKLNYRFGSNKHECYSINRNNKYSFTIHHYAGKVSYCALGFLEKNRDTLSDSVVDMFKNSRDDLIRLLFHGNPSDGSIDSNKGLQHRTAAEKDARNRLTVGAQYRNSLQILMDRMCASHPVFMRCLKPNQQKQAYLFDDPFVRAQLRYCGMLETTRIRKEGYSVRLSFEEFIQKYGLLSKARPSNVPSITCRYILEETHLTEWQLGKTKVFLKYYHPENLEKLMNKYRQAALLIQRRFRGYVGRKHFKQLKSISQIYKDEVNQFCANIEDINSQMIQTLTQLGDKFPGKTVPSVNPEDDHRPRPPVRESSLNSSSQINNTGLGGRYSLPTTKIGSPPTTPTSTLTTNQLMVDYDSLLSYLTLKYGSPGERESCLKWFRDTQYPYVCHKGTFPSWFHGNITRHRAEELLSKQSVGCFLIRLSESRFGFSLSFRAEDRCRHYMINQLKNLKYNVIGEAKVHKSLDELLLYYRTHELSNWDGHLTEPCKADWSQYDHESLTPIQNNTKNHANYHIKNSPAQLHKTSTLPISYYANPSFPYSTKICATRPMMMNNSLNASTKLPIAIVPPFTK
ncbi:unnamed protein product [Rotaria socialis]|uniref:non-specific serine/threonine protein kinase n=1 Tax=Rotaria socialis TaxID=392032 RepID=A0A818J2N8_9BILA|nr:unnamed protein product [Rotaria socialis]